MGFDLNLPTIIGALSLLLVLLLLLAYGWWLAQPHPERPSGPPVGAVAMERKVVITAIMSLGLIGVFGGYAIREPVRQAEAKEKLVDISVGRGVGLYTTLCYSCHGEKGQGALVPGGETVRIAPPLNRADLRPTDEDERRKKYDFIYKTIERGRKDTPMPAWGQTDGGSLFHEQINDITLFILNGERDITFEGAHGHAWEVAEELVKEHYEAGLIAELPKQPDVEQQPFYQALTDEQKAGVRVVLQRGCGSCHVIPNVPGAAGTLGPSLDAIGSRNPIAGGQVPNASVDDLTRWLQNPQALKPGSPMPNLGLSEQEARSAAEFLATLK